MDQALEPRRILVVEDEPFVRHELVDFFEDRGFEVLAAGNADKAICILYEQPGISILLTDIRMPGAMNGLRLAHVVKERHPPTVLLVALGVVSPAREDLPEGALFFAKPFNPRGASAALLKDGAGSPARWQGPSPPAARRGEELRLTSSRA